MPYIINNTRGEVIAVIPDGTTDTEATSVSLVGKNVTPYGEIETENLVKHLENFANSSAPANPLEGQIWYDTSEGFIKNYTGNQWKTITGLYVSATAPTLEPKVGELWLDTASLQLKVYATTDRGLEWVTNNRVPFAASAPDAGIEGDLYYNETSGQMFISDGASWSLIGPPAATGFPGTLWESASLRDLNGDPEPVILGKVNNIVVAIVAKRSFTILEADRPAGFVSLLSGINLTELSEFSGVATRARTLTPGRTINGVQFDASANINVGTAFTLSAGDYITGNAFDGLSNTTWSVNASPAVINDTIVARSTDGDFAGRNIQADLFLGNVQGIANNVNGIVAVSNGGTGQSSYANGEILIGNSGSLSKGNITGSGSITITNTAGGIDIGYSGGTGNGSVSSVGITAGTGISVAGSPITSSGSITVTNSGVTRINAGSGVSVDRSTGDVTITATGSGGGDMVLADAQTVTGRKTFTGTENIVAGAYRFTYPSDNGFWYDSSGSYNYIAVAFDNDLDSIRFYKEGLSISGDSDGTPGASTILAYDTGDATLGGSAIVAKTNATTPGFGVGLRSQAFAGFTGAAVQSEVGAVKGANYVHFRAYSDAFSPTQDVVFKVDSGGNVAYDGTARTPAADYAEYFEWKDGNPLNEDRVGMTVVLDGNKIRVATTGDQPFGVVSAVPGMVGDSAEDKWTGKYLKDEYGRPILQPYTIYKWTDISGNKPEIKTCTSLDDQDPPADAQAITTDENGNQLMTPTINPAWDPDADYIPRSQRQEWSPIGLLGKLRIRNDQVISSNWIYMREINDNINEYLVK